MRHHLEKCICDIRNCMKTNHLKLNDTKLEFIIIGYHTELCCLSCNDGINIGDSIIQASPSLGNIGVIFDHSLIMTDHIHAKCRVCYCHIRNIVNISSHLTKDAAITLIHAFVASKLNHMNALLYGLPKYLYVHDMLHLYQTPSVLWSMNLHS